eukprot:scaffold4071_cov63-Phaeocystis_antarctica.AAC.1
MHIYIKTNSEQRTDTRLETETGGNKRTQFATQYHSLLFLYHRRVYRRVRGAGPGALGFGAKCRIPEPLECSVEVPLFADEGVVGEGFPKLLVTRFAWPVRRDDTSGDHVVARAVGLRAVVLRARAIVTREVALQGEERSGRSRLLGRVAEDVKRRNHRQPLGLVHEGGQDGEEVANGPRIPRRGCQVANSPRVVEAAPVEGEGVWGEHVRASPRGVDGFED